MVPLQHCVNVVGKSFCVMRGFACILKLPTLVTFLQHKACGLHVYLRPYSCNFEVAHFRSQWLEWFIDAHIPAATLVRRLWHCQWGILENFAKMDRYHTTISYIDVITTTMTSQITSLTVVHSTVYSDADQRKHQSSASLAFVWGIHQDKWIPRTKGQLRGKCFPLMTSPW